MAFIYDLTDTWNAGGTTFNAIKMNVTDTASAAASKLVTLQVGGSERFGVDKAGIGTFASVIRAAGGSTSAPSFSFTSDTNTGMWSPSSDAIAFSTAGSERLRIDTSGNVGIGTNSPGTYNGLLNVKASDRSVIGYFGGTTYAVRLGANSSFGTVEAVDAATGVSSYQPLQIGGSILRFDTGGSERMRINGSGNVGIGTSSPGTRLQVRDTAAPSGFSSTSVRVTRDNYGADFSGYIDQGVGHGAIISTVDNGTPTERMRINGSGNVGIGTSSPGTRLDVSAIGLGTNLAGIFRTNVTGSYVGFFDATTSDRPMIGSVGDAFVARTSGSERMRIDSAGNLGLGVTPSAWGSFKAIQSSYYSIWNHPSVNAAYVGNNVYVDSGGSARYVATNPASQYQQYNGTHTWFTAPSGTAGNAISFTQAMTLTASAELILDSGSGGGRLTFVPGNAINSFLSTTTGFGAYNPTRIIASDIRFETGSSPSERARIDSSGNLLVGQSSDTAGSLAGIGVTGSNRTITAYTSAGSNAGTVLHARRDADGNAVQFVYGNWSTQVGTISVTSTATAYNTSSDYRLKDIDGPIQNSGAYIDALKPVQGSWKADGSRFIGLLAHEVQEVSETQIATGEKDGEEMQAMDYSAPEIIANLIAEIQSLRARVAQLEGN